MGDRNVSGLLFGILVAGSLLPLVGLQQSLVGEQAPDFSLQDLERKEVNLRSLRGHIVVLHFWATYWTSCHEEMKLLEHLNRDFKNHGVVIFGINVGQLPRVVREFVRRRGATYPQLINARGELILSYHATDAPTIIIIGKDGRIVDHLRDEQGEERLRSALTKAIE